MEFKLFGKSIFKATNKTDQLMAWASQPDPDQKKSKFLPDFYKGEGDGRIQLISDLQASADSSMLSLDKALKKKAGKKKTNKPEPKPKVLSPKDVFTLELLNDKSFELKVGDKYVEEQIETFTDKLKLIKSEEWDVRNGVGEVRSMLTRLENRRKYNKEVHKQFNQFAYTSSSKIAEMIKEHSNLKMGQVAQFIADMPKEAVEVMKEYNKYTDKLCGKQAVFYIIADKKDFQKTISRRDPILLAQSPFGHYWQILGAWDEEMLFLEEL